MSDPASEMMDTSVPGLREPRCMIVEGDKAYWVRVRLGTHEIDTFDTEERTLVGAVRWAEKRGHAPTHWCGRNGHISRLPSGIVLRSAAV